MSRNVDAKPGDVARLTDLTTGGVTQALDRLEKAGYVRRDRNPEDRRSVLIRMVPEGRRRVLEQHQSASQIMGRIVSAYGEKELALILEKEGRLGEARELYESITRIADVSKAYKASVSLGMHLLRLSRPCSMLREMGMPRYAPGQWRV